MKTLSWIAYPSQLMAFSRVALCVSGKARADDAADAQAAARDQDQEAAEIALLAVGFESGL